MNVDIKFKAVTFVKGNDIKNGYYFYEITLPDAISKMKTLGIDVVNDFKFVIAVYPW